MASVIIARHEGDYVDIDGVWTPSKTILGFVDSTDTDLTVFDADGVARPVPLAAVRRAATITPYASYSGFEFRLSRLLRDDGTLVWSAQPLDSADIDAVLWFDDLATPDAKAVAGLPGFETHDPRASNGGISGRVALRDLAGYREDVRELSFPWLPA